MIEYKTERVWASNESTVIEMCSHFGWKYVGSQDVYNSDTYVSGGSISGDSVHLEHTTNTSQYVAVRFQRDTEMPNYAKIKALNDEFDQLLRVQGPKIGMFIAFVLLSVTGILFPIAIIVLVVAIKKKKKYDDAMRRLPYIVRQADALLVQN